MPQITAASLTAFFLFDVAEAIDLSLLQKGIGAGAAEARFVPKSGAPSYFQYAVPPLVVDGAALGVPEVDGFSARFKFFDYGVVSLALTRPFSGDWPALVAQAQRYIENETLDDIHGFAVEQVAIARGQLMELTIVLILVFELVLFFAGIM